MRDGVRSHPLQERAEQPAYRKFVADNQGVPNLESAWNAQALERVNNAIRHDMARASVKYARDERAYFKVYLGSMHESEAFRNGDIAEAWLRTRVSSK